MILELLEEVKEQTGVRYVCHWKNNQLLVNDYGTNEHTYFFGECATMSTNNKVSIHDLVTKVKIIGSADDEGRTYVESVVEGDQSFGVLQKIVVRYDNTTLDEATKEAEEYIKKNGKPEETIVVDCCDVPFLRKGDKVKVGAGNLVGDFWVLGVSHRGTDRKMELTLERCE